jgi:molecular chaperone GrpE
MQQETPSKAEVERQESAGPAGGGSNAREEAVVDPAVGDEGREAEGAEATPPSPEQEAARWKELALRASADLDNYRKRMAREKTEALRYANQGLLEELLPVLDNFEMGLQAAAGDRESMIFRGMEMVKKQLDDFLRGQGVDEIPAEGQAFDPNVHEAVSQEECAKTAEGKVLRVIRRGYRMRDRLLRPAIVVVCKAPGTGSRQEERDEA